MGVRWCDEAVTPGPAHLHCPEPPFMDKWQRPPLLKKLVEGVKGKSVIKRGVRLQGRAGRAPASRQDVGSASVLCFQGSVYGCACAHVCVGGGVGGARADTRELGRFGRRFPGCWMVSAGSQQVRTTGGILGGPAPSVVGSRKEAWAPEPGGA